MNDFPLQFSLDTIYITSPKKLPVMFFKLLNQFHGVLVKKSFNIFAVLLDFPFIIFIIFSITFFINFECQEF